MFDKGYYTLSSISETYFDQLGSLWLPQDVSPAVVK